MTKRLLFVIVGSWSVLFLLTLPFSYAVFPPIGKYFTETALPLYSWISTTFFGIDCTVYFASSDAIAGYIQAGFLLMLSIPLGVLLLRRFKQNPEILITRLHQLLAYILALFLLKYGIDKLFLHQFYPPEPNTLFTPTGLLSKDILFWTTMGSSKTYSIFMGVIEVIPALLLCHRKTRMLGAFIAIGVFINVFFVNIGFDITVKLLSFVLLLTSNLVFAPYFARFQQAFFNKEKKSPSVIQLTTISSKSGQFIKGIVLLLMTIEVLYPYISFNSAEKKPNRSIIGTYEVNSIRTTANEKNTFSDVRRIHIHSKGYLITENNDGKMHDQPFQYDKLRSRLVLEDSELKMKHKRKTVTFQWNNGRDTITLVTRKIDLNKLPLRQDNAHLTVEGMLNSD